jgi:Cys-rich repeat protein
LVVAAVAAFASAAACGSKGATKPCTADSECAFGSTCDLTKMSCTPRECRDDSMCPLGSLCQDRLCLPGCLSNIDCPREAATCDAARPPAGACVECVAMSDCKADERCVADRCVEDCRTDADCSVGVCDTEDRLCVECRDDSNCALGNLCLADACEPGCVDSRGCPASAPLCDTALGKNGTCVVCLTDQDCTGGATCQMGQCQGGTTSAVDILFVIDDSTDMLALQTALMDNFTSAFLATLEGELGGRPDLHIGVVSSDMGVGSNSIGGCAASDDGLLLSAATVQGCSPPTDRYIVDVAAGGGRMTNYTGTISDAFRCIGSLGTTGCGFEQPLASMRRALDGSKPENAGFLRQDAALAVIILSSEDDCSAKNTAVFDPAGASPTSTLGPMSGYRCFEFGVRCTPDQPRTAGAKSGCGVRTDSPYITNTADYVSFLTALKPPGRLAVVTLVPPPGPIAVSFDMTGMVYSLSPACPGGTTGNPAVRYAAFTQALGAAGQTGSVCGDMAQNLTAAAKAVVKAMK